jgi:hypothetical protein
VSEDQIIEGIAVGCGTPGRDLWWGRSSIGVGDVVPYPPPHWEATTGKSGQEEDLPGQR